MIEYKSFKYIYPPRPKNSIPSTELNSWDNNTLITQPKLNGSNCLIFTNGEDFYAYNRHGQRLSGFGLMKDELLNLYSGKSWMVLNCEYLNKSKKNELGETFNHKLVLFDVLVHDGKYLIGKTFQERISLLDEIYGMKECGKSYLHGISENTYRVKSYVSNFLDLYNDLVKIDMIEGLVMKRKSAKLEIGASEMNNTKSQIKCRKKTLNYRY